MPRIRTASVKSDALVGGVVPLLGSEAIEALPDLHPDTVGRV